jgi:hypothetical protein
LPRLQIIENNRASAVVEEEEESYRSFESSYTSQKKLLNQKSKRMESLAQASKFKKQLKREMIEDRQYIATLVMSNTLERERHPMDVQDLSGRSASQKIF